MATTYLPIAVLVIISIGVAASMLIMSALFGPRRSNPDKMATYECGIGPSCDARSRVSIKYFMIAILFILFDIEVIFLYPWAINFVGLGWFGFIEMMVFLTILLIGYIYLYKKGAFEWE